MLLTQLVQIFLKVMAVCLLATIEGFAFSLVALYMKRQHGFIKPIDGI